MKLSNKVKQLSKRYWYVILICVAIILIVLAFATQMLNKDLLVDALEFFNKNINKYAKYNKKIDDEAFEKMERIEKRKEEIAKKINEEFKSKEKEIRKDINKKVQEELDNLDEDEEALENWYNDFLNSGVFTGN